MTNQGNQGKVDFSAVRWGSVEWTNLCTLYLRACESRLERPILGDRAAAEAIDRIHYDFARMGQRMRPSTNQFLVALRASQLDVWAAHFLRHQPDAVVLHLGCGLDSRAFRLKVPTETRWFDVDKPEVIALRRQLYEDYPGYTMIGASVTDPGWLEDVPTGHATLVVAEGLLPYLPEAHVRLLLERVTKRFTTGELLIDLMSEPLTHLLLQWAPQMSQLIEWTTCDGHVLTQWNPRLTCVEDRSVMADHARIPLKTQRLLYQKLASIPAIRNYDRLYRFRF